MFSELLRAYVDFLVFNFITHVRLMAQEYTIGRNNRRNISALLCIESNKIVHFRHMIEENVPQWMFLNF